MSNPLQNKTILLGLTGGIACYKSAELTRRLIDHNASVQAVMTEAATAFITPTTLQALSNHAVYTETLDPRMENSMAHINLSRQSDAILIAPASADFIAKLAHGMADDLLSTLCLARGDCPLIVAPAMNREMWNNPATQRNIAQLKKDGIHIWGPDYGEQACGEVGSGRMLDVPDIVENFFAFFSAKPLQGLTLLMTAGPTEETIDPIRVISNKSSGKTGYAIAQAAYRAGAEVILISGPTALAKPFGVHFEAVQSARQMKQAVMQYTNRADIFISVAAVADWYVKNTSEHKIKKEKGSEFPNLEFAQNPDILAEVATLNKGPWCVGFAAETNNLYEHAEAKRKRKKIDLLVANLAQDVMGQNNTQFILFDENGSHSFGKMSKPEAAVHLIHEIAKRYQNRQKS